MVYVYIKIEVVALEIRKSQVQQPQLHKTLIIAISIGTGIFTPLDYM